MLQVCSMSARPDAVPGCIHMSAPGPLHLKKAVQTDINADVAKGALACMEGLRDTKYYTRGGKSAGSWDPRSQK